MYLFVCVCVLDWVDYVMLAVYIVYQVCFFVFPLRTIIHHQLPTASAVVVVSEQVTQSWSISLVSTVKLLLNAGSRVITGSLINAGVLRPVF